MIEHRTNLWSFLCISLQFRETIVCVCGGGIKQIQKMKARVKEGEEGGGCKEHTKKTTNGGSTTHKS